MQPTTGFHGGITNAIRQEADFVFHHPIAFHPANGVFNTDANGGNKTIGGVLRPSEFAATPFLFRGCLKSWQLPHMGGYDWRHGTPQTVPDRPD